VEHVLHVLSEVRFRRIGGGRHFRSWPEFPSCLASRDGCCCCVSALFGETTHAAQFTFRPGSSDPPGPGTQYAGLGVFKYVTSCGTVYGHTGNIPGYTQFVGPSADGSHAVTVSINAQISPAENAELFPELRHIYELAVCAAR
jgi:hypothetical protein